MEPAFGQAAQTFGAASSAGLAPVPAAHRESQGPSSAGPGHEVPPFSADPADKDFDGVPPDELEDPDNAPTETFVRDSNRRYDPYGVPLPDDEGDEYEPPTAIHTSAFQGDRDSVGVSGFGGVVSSPTFRDTDSVNAGDGGGHPAVGGAGAAGPWGADVGVMAPQSQPSRLKPTRELPALSAMNRKAMMQQVSPVRRGSRAFAGGTPYMGMDQDVAPLWLVVVAIVSVMSAVAVLCVLGWLLSGRLF